MKRFLVLIWFSGVTCLLAACAAPLAGAAAMDAPTGGPLLKDYGPAPELNNTVWLNVDQPLHLADLRGKVVLLEMWTFDCVNCQHVLPALKGWYQKYAGKGLVIIGNHTPEFSYEASLDNLKAAVTRFEIPYAVAQDNDGATWKAYDNRYWPALYLIDKNGHIRYLTIGEGAYAETEAAIDTLLAEAGS